MNSFQIIVPFYNDFKNFESFISSLQSKNLPNDTFIIVDNGSNTNEITEFYNNSPEEKHFYKVVRSENNLGYGGGIVFGAKFINSEYIAWMPGNLKLDPFEVYNLFSSLDSFEDFSLIKALRKNRPKIDTIKTLFFGIIASLWFRTKMLDSGGVPCLVSKKLFENSDNFPIDFSFDVFILYYFKMKKLDIFRPKISYNKRKYGTSHWQKGLKSEIKLLFKILSYKNQWDEKIIKIKEF